MQPQSSWQLPDHRSHHSAGHARRHSSLPQRVPHEQLCYGPQSTAHPRRRAPESKSTSARIRSDRPGISSCSVRFHLHQFSQHCGEAGGIPLSLDVNPLELFQIASASPLHAGQATPCHGHAIHLEHDGLHRNSRCVPDAVGHILHYPSWLAKSAQPHANPVRNPNATACVTIPCCGRPRSRNSECASCKSSWNSGRT